MADIGQPLSNIECEKPSDYIKTMHQDINTISFNGTYK